MHPEECISRQKRFVGFANEWPMRAVVRPGLIPMKTQIRFSSRLSGSGDR